MASISVVSTAEPLWGFEKARFLFELRNDVVAELADPRLCDRVVGTVDLVAADGRRLRICEAPFPVAVPLGATIPFDQDIWVRAFEGEFEAVAGLALRREDGGLEALPVRSKPLPLRIRSTIFELFLELTNVCNFKCSFCPQPGLERKGGMMDLDLAKKVLADLVAMGHHHPIRLHLMGEPMLYKRFPELVEAVHAAGLKIRLATNGSRLSEPEVAMLFETRVDEIVVSLNTPEKNAYEEQRGTSLPFEDYMAGIDRFCRAVARHGGPPQAWINVLYAKDRAHDPVEQARIHGIAETWVRIVEEETGRSLPPVEEAIDLDPAEASFMQLTDDLQLQWTAYHDWGEAGAPRDHFCFFPWQQLAVLVDGKVTACCVDAEGEIVLGDARVESIADIWRGPEVERIRRSFLEGVSPTPRCARCDVRHDREKFFPSSGLVS